MNMLPSCEGDSKNVSSHCIGLSEINEINVCYSNLFRPSKSTQSTDDILHQHQQQIEFLNDSLDRIQAENDTLHQHCSAESVRHHKKHTVLIDSVTRCLQMRDMAVHVLFQLEGFASNFSANIPHIAKVG